MGFTDDKNWGAAVGAGKEAGGIGWVKLLVVVVVGTLLASSGRGLLAVVLLRVARPSETSILSATALEELCAFEVEVVSNCFTNPRFFKGGFIATAAAVPVPVVVVVVLAASRVLICGGGVVIIDDDDDDDDTNSVEGGGDVRKV